jgi:bifunctional non-homologous end joining protein LigD
VILEPPEARLTTSRPLRKTVAVRRKSTTFYAGKVDFGFDKASRKRLTPLIRKNTPNALRTRASGWSRSCSLAETKYRAKSAEGKVRHPFFKGLREGL